MKLEQQVVSLEFAKKLKELGVKQNSLFWWQIPNFGDFTYHENGNDIVQYATSKSHDYFSAFTVAELGEMLPAIIAKKNYFGLDYSRRDEKEGSRYMVAYTPISAAIPSLAFINDIGTEADARAKMLIYLLENKLINLE